jgi:hypothetical protein
VEWVFVFDRGRVRAGAIGRLTRTSVRLIAGPTRPGCDVSELAVLGGRLTIDRFI